MKVIDTYPPNIAELEKVFEIREKTLFTYGDTIYNPSGSSLEQHLHVHEEVHMQQQGTDPAGWWDTYIKDKRFRVQQELEAYQKQYAYYAKGKSRGVAFKFLHRLAMDLSSKMYGEVIDYQSALMLIKQI